MPRRGGETIPLREHLAVLREADERFYGERDRRLAEVAAEREKALKIKETADLAALSLAREIQDQKDEKANNLRSQIEGERGHYASKDDLQQAVEKLEAIVKPMGEYIAAQQGRSGGFSGAWVLLVGAVGMVVAVATLWAARK